ncbi:MAG TPA: hypothetical protein VF173_24935 [Thermoanaerobaculia bacterium]|nr:hypothetical protein [Thermoanaerobaculia bacterium]
MRPAPARPPAAQVVLASREVPRRSTAERVILAVLLCGLGLNAAVLLANPRLSRSDLVLGGTVLLAGLILLGLMELCRRSAPPPAE